MCTNTNNQEETTEKEVIGVLVRGRQHCYPQATNFNNTNTSTNTNTNTTMMTSSININISNNINININAPINDHDVFCGRMCGMTNSHTGNKRFRRIVADYQEEYVRVRTQKERKNIVSHIVSQIHRKGGRFLIQQNKNKNKNNTDSTPSSNGNFVWSVVKQQTIVNKISQALREGWEAKNNTILCTTRSRTRVLPTTKRNVSSSSSATTTTGTENTITNWHRTGNRRLLPTTRNTRCGASAANEVKGLVILDSPSSSRSSSSNNRIKTTTTTSTTIEGAAEARRGGGAAAADILPDLVHVDGGQQQDDTVNENLESTTTLRSPTVMFSPLFTFSEVATTIDTTMVASKAAAAAAEEEQPFDLLTALATASSSSPSNNAVPVVAAAVLTTTATTTAATTTTSTPYPCPCPIVDTNNSNNKNKSAVTTTASANKAAVMMKSTDNADNENENEIEEDSEKEIEEELLSLFGTTTNSNNSSSSSSSPSVLAYESSYLSNNNDTNNDDTHTTTTTPTTDATIINTMTVRGLRIEDALLYLDQAKDEFGDHPHIYNEFLDILNTFTTQQIDTIGVIRRVSNLLQGHRTLLFGFNTFLPEGYRIEVPDGDGPPVVVFRAPGEVVVKHDSGPNMPPSRRQQQQQRHHEQPQPQQGVPPEVALALGRTSGMQGTPGQQQQQGHVVPPGFEVMMGGRVGPVGPPSQQQHHHKHNGVMMDRMVGGVSGLANKVVMHAQQMGDPRGQQQQLQKQQQQQQQLGQHHAMGGGPTRGRPAETPQSHGHIGMPQQPQSQPGRSGMVMGQGNSQPSQHVIAQQQQQQQQMIGGTNNSTSTSTQNKQPSVANNGGAPPHQQQQQSPGVGQPLEFDHAINYVTTIKKRFADEPETYKKFLEILHTYQKEQRGIKEVLEEVSVLFEEHPDLLKEFTFFLPDAVQSEAKQQLEIVVKEAEERRAQKLAAAKQTAPQPKQRKQYVAPTPAPPPPVEIRPPSTSIAFGATAPRSVEREKEIHRSTVYGTVSFGPPRPPRKNVPTVAEAAKKEGRPTMLPPLPPQPITAETAFFERAKRHLSRRELAPDKPTGRARHTPYAEFLKCLHLFGSGVLNKDELVLLLRGLFVQGHAPKSGVNAGGGASNPAIATDAHELLNEFQEILIGRGPYADQQCSQKDKSNYGAKRSRDFELITRPTPSYAEYPKDYPHDLFMSHTGQTEEDLQVLNNILVSPFACNCSIKKRRNLYEEAMFRIEDERFEVDMAIERNALAMRKIEPIAEEVQMLREGEEKDGQPIGRLQYRLNPRTLNSIQINSIGRVYGENGDEVIQYLARNPLAVLPIIYQRLRQKDLEWRKQKGEMMPRWKAGCEANYEGSLDNLCHYKRRSLERTFGSEQLRDECKLARKYCSSQNNRKDNFVRFGLSVPDKSAVLYEPYAVVEMKPSSSVHHDAVDLLIQHVEIRCATRDDIREKAGRIWTEFMLCFFNYQSIWVEEEARKSFLGKINNSVVQYAIGERVMTTFGEGTIHSFTETDDEGPQYSVKLSSGFRTLQPPAVLHNIDANDGSKYFRRNDEMVKELDNTFDGSSSVIVDKKFKVLFGTDSIYIFLRLYSFLISLLDDIKEYLLNNPTIVDPSLSYYNPMKSADDRHKEESKFDFATVIVKLHEVLAKKMSHKEFESFARLVNRDIVHKIAALPKLVQRCGDMMIKMSEEDLLPHIYDVCQYSGQNPVTLRSTCMSISPSAEYRIQYNASNGRLYFSYLSEEEELSTVPMGDDDDDDDDMEDGEMEDDYDDEDDMDLDNEAEDLREVKRMKVR